MADLLWSILTPAIPSRMGMLAPLAVEIDRQIRAACAPVEHLVVMDNRVRTIGGKRQALLDLALGEYISFVDDDDHVTGDYVSSIYAVLRAERPDLVVFPIRVTINGGQDGIVEPSVQYAPEKIGEPLEPYRPPITRRPPHELLVWRTEIARLSRFPDQSGKEDFLWAEHLWRHVKREVRIPKVLYHWDFNIARREHVSV